MDNRIEPTPVVERTESAPEAGAATPEDPGGPSSGRTDGGGAKVLKTTAMVRSIPLEVQATLERADSGADAEDEVVFAVSSEFEVMRDWPFEGIEVLDHAPSSVRLDRFKNGAAVVAGSHFDGELVGATRDAWLGQDRRLWVRARFGSVDAARRERALIQEDIRKNVSIRYRIHKLEHTPGRAGQPDRYRATDWEPIHVALVNDPEDPTVGFGREASPEVSTVVVDLDNNNNAPGGETMTAQNQAPAAPDGGGTITAGPDRSAILAEVKEQEAVRRREILALGREFNRQELAMGALERGDSVLQFKDALLDSVKPGEALESNRDPAHLGMSQREVRRYSFFRALRHLEDRNNPRLRDEAGLELEASAEIAKSTGQDPRGMFVPTDVLRSNVDVGRLERMGLLGQMTHGDKVRSMMLGRAEMGATVATLGQALVPTDHLAASFIDVLRNTSAIMPRATVLSGLSGNVEIPRKTVATAGTWVATEGANTAEDDVTLDQVTLTARDIGAHVILRRRLLLQSSVDVEDMIRMDLAMAIGLGVDLAAIQGTGASGQPTGFLNNGSIGSWSLATDPPATHVGDPQWTDVVALWKLVAQGNALFGDLGWLMGANHAAHFLSREKATASGRFVMEDLTQLLGYPVILSEQCPLDTVAFLNFRQVVVGLFGGVDILVDPYSQSKSASVIVRAIQTADVAVRQEAGIAAWQDSTLT